MAGEAAHRIHKEAVGGPELGDGGTASIAIALVENLHEVAKEHLSDDGLFGGGSAIAAYLTRFRGHGPTLPQLWTVTSRTAGVAYVIAFAQMHRGGRTTERAHVRERAARTAPVNLHAAGTDHAERNWPGPADLAGARRDAVRLTTTRAVPPAGLAAPGRSATRRSG